MTKITLWVYLELQQALLVAEQLSPLTLLHLERPKLYAILDFLSAIGLKHKCYRTAQNFLTEESSMKPCEKRGEKVVFHLKDLAWLKQTMSGSKEKNN